MARLTLTVALVLLASRTNGQEFSQLLAATGVYHEGDAQPTLVNQGASKATTYRPNWKQVLNSEIARAELEVEDTISVSREKEENKGKSISFEKLILDEPTSAVGNTEEFHKEQGFDRLYDVGNTRRFHQARDYGRRANFMEQARPDRRSFSLNSIPRPVPMNLGFPGIESFFHNFQNNVDWTGPTTRTKRDSGSEENTSSLTDDIGTKTSVLKKRDAEAMPSRLNHISVLPLPHDVPPKVNLPLFPPLGGPPPHPTPIPHSGHHVTISTPTHHVSHGVTDHGTHQAVHKEHHQVHGGHVSHHGLTHKAPLKHLPVPLKHHTPMHTVSKSLPHRPAGYPKPTGGGSLEDIFGIKHGYHAPEPAYHAPEPSYIAPEPAYHAPEPAYHAPEPAYIAPEPAYHAPEPAYQAPEPAYIAPEPAYHAPEPAYIAPKPAYHAPEPAYEAPKPAYHAPEPAYHAPEPEYHAPEPEYHAPEPEYHAPEPAYHAPEPAYHAPEPAYHAPEPEYHAPEPAYHAPEPEYHAPEPTYVEPKPAYKAPEPAYIAPEPVYEAPKPAYKAPEPAYHAPKPSYKPNYKHPSGDYVPPGAHMAGHPFSLEHVFGISMPQYYMEKYPHMAHMVHKHQPHLLPVDNYVEPPMAMYHPMKVYDHPKSGYPKPVHGATLEEIFGVHTIYHPAIKPAYHPPKPEYKPPKPEYHPPKPEYNPPKPEYHPPKPEHHPPKPEYNPPKPEYHPPKPEYHAPEPAYHPPKPAYHPPVHSKSLEDVFGLNPKIYATPVPSYESPPPLKYVTPAPLYEAPTTYKPKMPEYVEKPHPTYKSLPDPGFVLHYLPYQSYKPVHAETLAHPPPVPHHPHAAHMLVPGTHVLPDLLPHNPHPEVKSLHDPFRGARQKRSPQTQG